MKKRKILLTVLLCITMMAGLVAGCGKKEKTADKEITKEEEPEAEKPEEEPREEEPEEQLPMEEPEEQPEAELPTEEPEAELPAGEPEEEPEEELPIEEPEEEPEAELPTEEPEEKPDTEFPEGTPVELHGALHVEGTQLTDANGEPFQLRGVSTAGLSWYPQFANKDAFQTMYEEWGINVVRLAMYTDEYAGYCVGDDNNRDKLKDLVKTCVEDAADLGIYVIVDWHILRDEDPNKYKDQAIAFFDEMSELYGDYDNIIYEICNEPNGSATWSKVKSYAEEVIPTIRANDEDAVIIVGTPTWSQDVDKALADPIEGYDNIMYALHFYAATHTEWLRSRMTDTIDKGLPIFVTEFGICDASGNGRIDYYQSEEWIKSMNQYGVSYCIWNLSNKDESSSLLAPSTTSVAGWSKDQLSASGQWFVEIMKGSLDSIGTSGITAPAQSDSDAFQGSNDGYIPPTAILSEVSIQDCKISVDSPNTWKVGTECFYQLEVVLDNQSALNCKDWTITVTFSGNVTVSKNWCCGASATGNQLKITPESWNATVNSGSSTNDIGVIVSSDAAIIIDAVELSATIQ
ncbi:MAG: cellulase family glycosylhydrolase [Lachnospiraceae bacterium]|nr:cellulase family glycosylhydrolase [Lachnospiraceae bacterium]